MTGEARHEKTWRLPDMVFAAIGAACLLWAASGGSADLLGWPGVVLIAGLGCALVAAVLWLVRAITFRRRSLWSVAVVPVLGLLTAVLLATDAPLTVRWQLSRAAFETVASRQVLPSEEVSPQVIREDPHRVGAYRVTAVETRSDAVVFYQTSPMALFESGFAYFPKGAPEHFYVSRGEASREDAMVTPLGGPWYRWVSSF